MKLDSLESELIPDELLEADWDEDTEAGLVEFDAACEQVTHTTDMLQEVAVLAAARRN